MKFDCKDYQSQSCKGRGKEGVIWTVNDLKIILRRLGLPVSGNKDTLCQRLDDYCKQETEIFGTVGIVPEKRIEKTPEQKLLEECNQAERIYDQKKILVKNIKLKMEKVITIMEKKPITVGIDKRFERLLQLNKDLEKAELEKINAKYNLNKIKKKCSTLKK